MDKLRESKNILDFRIFFYTIFFNRNTTKLCKKIYL